MSLCSFVIIDFDGVLVDSEPLHARIRSSIARRLAGVPQYETPPSAGGASTADEYRNMLAQFGIQADPEALAQEHYARLAPLILETLPAPREGLLPLLDGLDARGVGYGVCSSSPRAYLETVLSGYGILSRFRFVVNSDDVPRVKPAPDLYLLALARSGVSAECALALEDSRNGVASAHAAGLRCIGYLPCRTGQDLSAADGLITRLPELLAWVRPSGHSCV